FHRSKNSFIDNAPSPLYALFSGSARVGNVSTLYQHALDKDTLYHNHFCESSLGKNSNKIIHCSYWQQNYWLKLLLKLVWFFRKSS
uniref:Uncharacterized protein n=1 Tax=Junco hyemalis TaxID=40217 RepID=A0A8C5J283_JUNHY